VAVTETCRPCPLPVTETQSLPAHVAFLFGNMDSSPVSWRYGICSRVPRVSTPPWFS